MPPEVRIEHRYPTALAFLRHHGPQAVAILHVLLTRAERERGVLVARASTREIQTGSSSCRRTPCIGAYATSSEPA